MTLSNKAKNYILKHHTKKSVSGLSSILKIDEAEIQSYIDEISPKLSIKKKLSFYVITFSIPILFFLALEWSLRSMDYMGNTDLFINPDFSNGEYLMPNPNFAARYFFYTKTIPSPSIDVFLKEKPENSLRIFAMGGSSAAGYPYGFNGTFSRVVDDILSDAFPQKNVEVVNVATSAISSYTLFDQADELIEQQPDAIMIYAGHNEFYGALGIGSNENLGAFPSFVRFYLKLQRFKTFLFIRQIITDAGKWMGGLFGRNIDQSATLMERIIKDQSIALYSPEYELAMRQFQSNMNAILDKFSKNNIPVYVATIASNIKDQPPFVIVKNETMPSADSVFFKATALYNEGNFKEAESAFQYAKDLDGLKFRAPSQINEIIKQLPQTFENLTVVPVFQALKQASDHGIIGNTLMLEHLHPNQKGYFIMGKTFAIALLNDLQKNEHQSDSFQIDEEEYYHKMFVTDFDHQVVSHRIRTLKQGFPFQHEEGIYQYSYKPISYLDSLAFNVVHKNMGWDVAKVELAQYYKETGELDKAISEYKGLIRNQPWNASPYLFAARIFLNENNLSEAYSLMSKAYEIEPENAFTSKMLGALELQKGNVELAIKLLEKSRKINPDDAQMLYNLSGAYGKNNEFNKALRIAEEVLTVNPQFPGIKIWYAQLKKINTDVDTSSNF